jgi:hypothetical protein
VEWDVKPGAMFEKDLSFPEKMCAFQFLVAFDIFFGALAIPELETSS